MEAKKSGNTDAVAGNTIEKSKTLRIPLNAEIVGFIQEFFVFGFKVDIICMCRFSHFSALHHVRARWAKSNSDRGEI